MKISELTEIIRQRITTKPEKSYITQLVASGEDRVLQKVFEEAGEAVIALKNEDRQEQVSELSDLFFHILIAMEIKGIKLTDIEAELERRHKN